MLCSLQADWEAVPVQRMFDLELYFNNETCRSKAILAWEGFVEEH